MPKDNNQKEQCAIKAHKCSRCDETSYSKSYLCRKCALAYIKEWQKKNKDKVRAYRKKRDYKKIYANYGKQYKLKNKTKVDETRKKWASKNRGKIRESYRKHWHKQMEKIRNSPVLKTNRLIGSAIWESLKTRGISKNRRRWERLVGYTKEELVKHLESKFTEEMNWQNHGTYWHIDHIKPKSLFVFISVEDEEFKKCWALENLQPLEKIANIKKFNHYGPNKTTTRES